MGDDGARPVTYESVLMKMKGGFCLFVNKKWVDIREGEVKEEMVFLNFNNVIRSKNILICLENLLCYNLS